MKHDSIRFSKIVSEYDFYSKRCGIGTMGEKALHAVVKSYYEPDECYREVDVLGFVADIKYGDRIIEIQTTSFNRLNKKLEKYLEEYYVTVVYPIALNKHIVWIDPETGAVVAKNKSNKKGSPVEFLYEASKIRRFINHERLRFELLFVDVDEYKLLDGYGPERKSRCTKLYKMPVSLQYVTAIESAKDVKAFLPPEITDGRFTFAEFEKIMKIKDRRARYSLNALIEYGIVHVADKSGKVIIYEGVN